MTTLESLDHIWSDFKIHELKILSHKHVSSHIILTELAQPFLLTSNVYLYLILLSELPAGHVKLTMISKFNAIHFLDSDGNSTHSEDLWRK